MASKLSSRPCRCSPACDATTRRSFAPGHDARMVSRLAVLVAAGSFDLEQAALLMYQAGGSSALITKLIRRMAAFPVRWHRVTETTAFEASDTLAVQYFGSREVQGLPPWILVRTCCVDNDIVERPELVKGKTREPAFWSVTDAVIWQANEQRLNRSDWQVWTYDAPFPPDPVATMAEWEWLDK